MNTADKEQTLRRISQAIFFNCSAAYLVDAAADTYEELFADEDFKAAVGPSGTLTDLYKGIFQQISSGEVQNNKNYDAFVDESLFKRDSFTGNVTMPSRNGLKSFIYRVVRTAENENTIYFMENTEGHDSDRLEKMKMDTIQENYLFSMIVDLKKDTCRNSATTEINADRQDYLDIKYSRWRYMIANMFMPNDKSMFLSASDPENIIERLEKEKLFRMEIQMQNMQGEYIWVRLSFSRMKDFSRENPIFVYTVQDINEDMLRLLHQENIIAAVEEKNKELDNINKAKTVFISNMSHEIRTPINAVLGMDEMILRESSEEHIRQYAYNIRSAGRMLLSIINDILDYSKIEAGKMEIIPVEYSSSAMLDDICSIISIKVKEKNLKFNVNIAEDIPSRLYGDELRIKQIIINILTNAVKYTEKGSVTFTVDCVGAEEEGMTGLRVKVEDTGIGMRKEDMSRLFTAFERLEEKRNRNIEGTGLGMSIVVRLLEQMGSKLDVDSVYGQGSSFSFVLPQKVIDSRPAGSFESARKKRLENEKPDEIPYAPSAKVLAVDDTSFNLTLVTHLLKRTGIKPDTASSGEECLKKVSENHYDLILLDHVMPGMDGVETLDRLRRMGGSAAHIPVIALTANVMSGARERYLNAGFSDFIEKPIVPSKLEAALVQYLPPELLEKREK
ncbi:MAG: response regulator [Huintestinicola sp.]|uniref:PAS domain-containing hybrid sensor histidine kinase/response regulator n=1 Tax=Huintestinicola sp. TaxID=2981661 RepID=UPI003F02E17D